MKSLAEQLAQYEGYHRDKRNVATHFVGIPLIVISIFTLLSRPVLFDGLVPVTLALVLAVLSTLFYFRLDKVFGLIMSILMMACLGLGNWSAQLGTETWLAIGIGAFVVGWVIQLVGHFFEGRKPAFLDDIVGLMIGPLFIVAELMFMLGLQRQLQEEIKKISRQ